MVKRKQKAFWLLNDFTSMGVWWGGQSPESAAGGRTGRPNKVGGGIIFAVTHTYMCGNQE